VFGVDSVERVFRMPAIRVAVIFDDQLRPETTGRYCERALHQFLDVQHFLPDKQDSILRSRFDLYLRIDDGLEFSLPVNCRPVAWWAIDTHLDFDRCLSAARAVDLTFAAQRDGADALRRAGIAGAIWLPLACDPTIHRPHDLPKQHDVSFVGNVFPGPRSQLLNTIRPRYHDVFVGNRYFEEMAKTYSASKIVFNRSIRNDVNMRVFEALACGSLLMTNDLSENGQNELFQDGVHLATYRNAEEMLDKIAFYLTHPEARAKVERAGKREVIEKHTYRHRMETIMAAVERLPAMVPVATPIPPPSAYDPGYFEFDRPELVDRIPSTARDILDVGCGAGRLGASLKARQRCRVTGLEIDPVAAAAARQKLDEVHEGDVEATPPPLAKSSYDATVCGDVLEHMRDPLAFLRHVRDWIRPDGRLVTSIPNVRNHTVVQALLAGNWTYEPAGLLDRTHLRFFTRREIEKLFYRAGFEIESLSIAPTPEHADWVARGRPGEVHVGRLHIGGMPPEETEEFYVYQYLVVAKPVAPPDHGLTSIVILTHNQLEYTRRCVDSIRLVTDEPFELIFVDNGSTDGTPGYLQSLAATDRRVKVIANAKNRGFPAGCNQGIAASDGKQVLLLNNDTVVTTGWLARMLRALHSDPKVGLVGPYSDNVSGEQHLDASFDGPAQLDGYAWDVAKRHAGQIMDNDRLVGFCLLIRREVIEQIGELDEHFGVGCFEDDDYCRRAMQAGFRAVIARDTFIHHVGGATFRAAGIDYAALMYENQSKYRDKWDKPAQPSAPTPVPLFGLNATPDGALLLERIARPVINGTMPVVSTDSAPLESIPPDSCLCMIVRDNASTIGPCLTSIRPWVGKMVVVDTGSKDDTPKLCKELGAEVFYFPWCDDFSAARNESLRHGRGRWLFWMDSDDTIDETNGRGLRDLVHGRHRPTVLGYVVQVHCPARSGEADDVTQVDHVKLIRNRPELRFDGRIHEQILPAIRKAGGEVAWTDLFVTHSGYDRSPDGQERKKQRDFRLLRLELAERPNHPFTLFNLGMTYADVNEHEQAVEWLQKSIAHSKPEESHLRKAYSLLVYSLSKLERLDEAMRECEAGLGVYPLDTELRFRRAILLGEQKRFQEAIAVYEDVLVRGEERHFTSIDAGLRSYKTRHNMATTFEDMGEFVKAEEQWRAVVREVPSFRAGWRGLSGLLLKQGKIKQAEELAAQMASDPFLAAEAAILSAHIALERKDIAEARRMLESATGRFPRDIDLLRTCARVLFEQINAVEAEPVLYALLKLEPDDPSTWCNLGSVRQIQRRFDEAAEAYRQALARRPNCASTHTALGNVLYHAGRTEEAARSWEQAARIRPGYPAAIAALRQIGRLR